MSNLEITKCEEDASLPRICDLEYGTFITNVPLGNNCVYIKVKKKIRSSDCGYFHRKNKRGLHVDWDPNHCILLNLSYGTLRQIPAKTRVTPLKPKLTVAELKPHCFKTVMKGFDNNC